MLYLVTAYRWGFREDPYPVYVGSVREEADVRAERESADRGGKYGLEVAECVDGPEEMKFTPVRYIPSAFEESAPRDNHVRDLHERLGSFAYMAATERCIMEPEESSTLLVTAPVEPPDWLLREVARLQARLDYWESHP